MIFNLFKKHDPHGSHKMRKKNEPEKVRKKEQNPFNTRRYEWLRLRTPKSWKQYPFRKRALPPRLSLRRVPRGSQKI